MLHFRNSSSISLYTWPSDFPTASFIFVSESFCGEDTYIHSFCMWDSLMWLAVFTEQLVIEGHGPHWLQSYIRPLTTHCNNSRVLSLIILYIYMAIYQDLFTKSTIKKSHTLSTYKLVLATEGTENYLFNRCKLF